MMSNMSPRQPAWRHTDGIDVRAIWKYLPPYNPPPTVSKFSSGFISNIYGSSSSFYNFGHNYACNGHECKVHPPSSPPQTVPNIDAPVEMPPPLSKKQPTKQSPTPVQAAVTTALPEKHLADPEYVAFRTAWLDDIKANEKSPTPGMKRPNPNPRNRAAVEDDGISNFMRRQRRNEIAKKSRDLIKQKKIDLTIRVAYLEKTEADLRARLLANAQCFYCRARAECF